MFVNQIIFPTSSEEALKPTTNCSNMNWKGKIVVKHGTRADSTLANICAQLALWMFYMIHWMCKNCGLVFTTVAWVFISSSSERTILAQKIYHDKNEAYKFELTHSTRLSSPDGLALSTGFCPVISSKSTTPKEKTSDFSVNLPLDAYSGAKYLKVQVTSVCVYI